ncbi:MAG: hypothetical protein O7C56_03225, partial [Rickettsia endosymbiont of Ixodes persulcatus]|nr:hypothetical protein [Rickettsia endosymbiont of Ixodes persulcatus]
GERVKNFFFLLPLKINAMFSYKRNQTNQNLELRFRFPCNFHFLPFASSIVVIELNKQLVS